MVDKQSLAQATKEYLDQIPQSQASIRTPDMAQVLTDKLGTHVTTSDIIEAEQELNDVGVSLNRARDEYLPLVEPSDRKVRMPTKSHSKWASDLGQRVKERKQRG